MKILIFAILAVVLVGCSQPPPTSVSGAAVSTFSENDVREFVTPGRTISEITNRFGRPGAVMTNDGRIVMWFSNPIALVDTNTPSPFAFSTSFTNGMVEKWEVLHLKVQSIK
jgi:hypothetical protein